MRFLRIFVIFLSCWIISPSPVKGGPKGDEKLQLPKRSLNRYEIYLLTVSPGDWLYTYFGHNALRVVDLITGRDYTYNFGTFSIPPSFKGVLKFAWEYLQLRNQYWLSRSELGELLRKYRRQDRTVSMRKLNLSPRESRALAKELFRLYRPKNRAYYYHHYRANCSTKVRDLLALAVGPLFRERAQVKRGETYRKLVLKKVRKNPLLMLGMDFGMGPPADRPLSRWEEMFLPERVEEYVAAKFWRKERGRPLASTARILYRRMGKEPSLFFSPQLFILAFALFWGLLGFGLWNRKGFFFWLRTSLLGLSLSGLALFVLLFLSNFPTPKGNANAFFYHPFHLIPFWILARRRWENSSPKIKKLLGWYFALQLAVLAVYTALKIFRLVPIQYNYHYLVLAAIVFIGGLALSLSSLDREGNLEELQEPIEFKPLDLDEIINEIDQIVSGRKER